MKKLLCLLTLSAVSLLMSVSTVFAAGFALPEQSASAMGMSSAFTGQADDASAVWYNPAALTQLDGTRVAGGFVAIYPTFTHENVGGTTDVGERGFHYPLFLYATHKLNDNISLGFGINNPFGLSTSWSNTGSATKQVATFSSIKTTEFNPNIAYKLNDKLSVAVGIAYVKLDATLRNELFTGQELTLTGDGTGWGGNAAVFYKATDKLNLGLSYRSEIQIKVDGSAIYTVGGIPGGGTPNSATTEVTLPDLLQLGASYKATDKLTLNADFGYTWWSTYDRLVLKSNTFLFTGSNTITQEKQWKDVWNIRIGGQYKLSDEWKLRAGYQYDKTPVPDAHFETRVPDSDRQGVSVGAGYAVGNLTVDAAYLYVHFNTRHIADSTADDGTTTPNALNGTYKSDAHVASLMVGYKF